jgi:vacuolar-type H+-ATPase subunit H
VADRPVEQPDDERLLHLLAVEQRLQDLVQRARDDANRRVTAARSANEERLAQAREAAKRADSEQMEAERVNHAAALAEIQADLETALARISAMAEREDELARWVIAQAISETREPT